MWTGGVLSTHMSTLELVLGSIRFSDLTTSDPRLTTRWIVPLYELGMRQTTAYEPTNRRSYVD